MEKSTIFSQYCITVGMFCVLLYLYGFFPVKKSSNIFSSSEDFPATLQDLKFHGQKVYNGSVLKTILMVIDGLRVDFVTPENMPYTGRVVAKGCQLDARVSAPTVTLPRIKAIVTGSVSGFVDVVLNFGTAELMLDNIIQQYIRSKRAVFYGDDTWIKLFPRHFTRSEGTSSFFVNDYTEVDNNVTRNLDEELLRSDWDLMILHYLGVDHIGHIEGPKGSLIKPKLKEMDQIIHRLHSYLLKQDKGVLVICGDHGMKDSGSHGGVSLPEILVPVVVLGLSCPDHFRQEILQVDLAASLSVLWGTPIPADNIGVVSAALVSHLTPVQRLYTYLYNGRQLANNFLRNGGSIAHESYQKFEHVKHKHYEWLTNTSKVTNSQVEELYQESLLKMSRFLSEALTNYNMMSLISAIAILFQVVCVAGFNMVGVPCTTNRTIWQSLMLSLVLMSFCWITQIFPSLQAVMFACGLIFCFNFIVLHNQFQQASIFIKTQQIQINVSWRQLVPVGTVLFCLSLFSSSLIEEEHQLWYFLWTTVAVLHLADSPTKWFCVLVSHRLLRTMNQTGDKWAHQPDLSDWFSQPSNRILLSALCMLGLICVALCCVKVYCNRLAAFLYLCCAFCIYQHKACINQVVPIIFPWSNKVTQTVWRVLM